MVAIVWDQLGQRVYQSGVDRVVLYPSMLINVSGVAWNGVTSIEEDSSGGELESYYRDGNKYMDVISNEDYKATLTCISVPSEFTPSDGGVTLAPGLSATQQPRSTFFLSYRSMVGSDTSDSLGYKIHLVYNLTASPSKKTRATKSNTVSVVEHSWDLNAVPTGGSGYKPTAHFIVDSTKANPTKLASLEQILYGTATQYPYIPSAAYLINLLT